MTRLTARRAALLPRALAAAAAPPWLRPRPPLAEFADARDRIETALRAAEDPRPEACLARLGDKRFVFAPDGTAFMMAARWGGSLIAMGGPIGRRAAWGAAFGAFRAAAAGRGLRPVVYQATPEALPLLAAAGFATAKIGETAIVPLSGFTLSGKAKQDLRTARRRMTEREGATFGVETLTPEGALMAELAPVSQAWLAHQRGGEKGFSLGRFDAGFLDGAPAGVVRIAGRPAAFATLWTTPCGRRAAIDLMRYDPARCPPSTMDFLVTETLLWAQAQGFESLDLGLAPLSGLSEERDAVAALGRLVYSRGGALYNFEGLRRFKAKFGPNWEPRHLAAPSPLALPLVLADVAFLNSGGPLALLGAKR